MPYEFINPLDHSLTLITEFGFFRVVLPLILVFAVVYGILKKTAIFGKDDDARANNINAIIAFAIAFFVISSTEVVEALNDVIPTTAFLLVVAMLVMMLLAFFGYDPENSLKGAGKGPMILGGFLLLVLLAVIDASFNYNIPIVHQIVQFLTGSLNINVPDDAINMLISVILIFGLPIAVLYLVVRDPSGKVNI